MNWIFRLCASVVVAVCFVSHASADPSTRSSVSPEVQAAVIAYLKAPPLKEKETLAKGLDVLHGDVALVAEALRTLPPLTTAAPGTYHGVKFTSGGKTWEYSVHLPASYDGKKRFPVLVLPDHGLVSPEDGIGFWKDKPGAKDLIIFRPVIAKYQEDKARFPEQQFFKRDEALAKVMHDALVHLRLNYAVDHDRFVMTGLSQAGYYTYYYAVSFPDDFAGIVPESAGGVAVRAAVVLLSPNLKDMNVRILHSAGDQIVPYADAQLMHDTLKQIGGHVELITYQDSDYPGEPFPQRHPGPHNLRLKNVLEWIPKQKRTLEQNIKRMLRYSQQGNEGQWLLTPPKDPTKPVLVTCANENGVLTCDHGPARYFVSPEDVVAKKRFKVDGKDVTPLPDLKLMLTRFKALGDPARLTAAQIVVP
jgi:predicted esterase